MKLLPLTTQKLDDYLEVGTSKALDDLVTTYALTSSQLRDHKDKLNWALISKYQTLSHYDYVEFGHLLNWNVVSRYQVLTAELIRNFKLCVNWYWISKEQPLTPVTLNEFSDELFWDLVSMNSHLEDSLIEQFMTRLDMRIIYLHHPHLKPLTWWQRVKITLCKLIRS